MEALAGLFVACRILFNILLTVCTQRIAEIILRNRRGFWRWPHGSGIDQKAAVFLFVGFIAFLIGFLFTL